jgi:UDP-N-acetylmuramate dehydrogenase
VDRALFDSRLRAIVGPNRVEAQAPLAPLTTFRVGGSADWLVDVATVDELSALVCAAADSAVPITILGSGSNVVIADSGIEGIVLRPRLTGIQQVTPALVRAESGVTINGLVRWMIGRGLAGLEAWAGTPGTVGGAIAGNAHWQGRNIGDVVARVLVVSSSGRPIEMDRAEMSFAYDTSRVQRTGEIVAWADLSVVAGVPAELRARARASLAYRKATQPLAMPSAGCMFQNPDPAVDRLPDGVPASAGALIDRANFKGRRIGGASISATHANFIVNDGNATAADIRALAELARDAVSTMFGVRLKDEVRYLGTFSNG